MPDSAAPSPAMSSAACIVWGPELSPFLLKLESMLVHHGVAWRRLPRDGTRLENVRVSLRIRRAVRTRTALRPPANDVLDEYPLVPFLLTESGAVLYDSTALASWLDQRDADRSQPLVPVDPAARFVAALIDEAFDEFGLYMVHHNRWKLAAADNDSPGARLAREYARLLPPASSRLFAQWFARRQVRRLPYLFSVAPDGYRVAGLSAPLTPPARPGFPPTHDLLEEAWRRYLRAIETVLEEQPFLLGPAFTLADASAYGQLSMNLTDGLAARRLRELAPRTFDWLVSIRERRHAGTRGEPVLAPCLQSLLEVVMATYVPLMQANAAACAELLARGEPSFNEKAFDKGRGLFDGELLGHRYRSVARSFQARSWRDLCALWSALDSDAKRQIAGLVPGDPLDATFVAPAVAFGAGASG
ncbi:MAG TPA: glutathione binding-like protein [Candidatus Limnocylindrales bacterium]|nr:glutathione binding-like protein [Candidatus Limnocylindrales bacterium]